jgi:glucose-1-phosphate thymidylyltransferase
MIYYPIATLMLAGIRELLIITTIEDFPNFEKLLGNGNQFGLDICYKIQNEPRGIAEAFIIGSDFIGNSQVCLILGDNLFYGKLDFLRNAIIENNGGTIFGYEVQNPQDFGVITLDNKGSVINIEEKPINPSSNLAIPGIYIFDNDVIEISKSLKPSNRGELEITDIHKEYLSENKLQCKLLGRGIAWLDTGTPTSLLEAGMFIHLIEQRQGRKIACLEEIALINYFISTDELEKHLMKMPECSYKNYCQLVLSEYKRK